MNWKKIINELLARYGTQEALAEQLKCSQPVISQLKNGKRGKHLSYSLAEKIVRLHTSK